MTADSTHAVDRALTAMHVASGDLWGGAESVVLELAIAQVRLGHSVHAVLFNDGLLADRLRSAGIRTTVIPESSNGPLALLRGVRRACLDVRPDVVHSHRMKETVIGAVAARSAAVPVCLRTVHGDNEHALGWHQWRKGFARIAERIASATLLDATVAVSAELGERLRRRRPAGRIEVIENGIDPDRVRREAEDHATPARAPAGAIRVGLVGRLVPVKRVDLFLDACGELARLWGTTLEAVVVGDGPLRQDLERQAAQLRIVGTTFSGFVDNPASWIRDFDLLAITSDHEGLPMCVLEAFALGVPVVARAVGGIPALLHDGRRGRLVDDGDATSFAAAMKSVLDSGRRSDANIPAVHFLPRCPSTRLPADTARCMRT